MGFRLTMRRCGGLRRRWRRGSGGGSGGGGGGFGGGDFWGFEDGVALYRSGDILAIGWMANAVRERMHGDIAYFNVNRHINPTNVCVASCRLCAFGRKKGGVGP